MNKIQTDCDICGDHITDEDFVEGRAFIRFLPARIHAKRFQSQYVRICQKHAKPFELKRTSEDEQSKK